MQIIKKISGWAAVLIAVLGIAALLFAAQYARTRPVQYAEYIHKYAKEYHMDPLLIIAVIKVESDFQPEAVSSMDARGLMQVLPKTGAWIADEIDEPFEQKKLFDPETNIRYGTYYLRYLIDHFNNEDVAIAAYNGGMGNVTEWIDDDTITKEGEKMESIPIDETRNYVTKVKTNKEIYRKLYGDQLPTTDTEAPSVQAIAQNFRFLFGWFFSVR